MPTNKTILPTDDSGVSTNYAGSTQYECLPFDERGEITQDISKINTFIKNQAANQRSSSQPANQMPRSTSANQIPNSKPGTLKHNV